MSKQNQSIPYELRNCNTFQNKRANSVKYGTEKIYLAPKIWLITPETIKKNKFFPPFSLLRLHLTCFEIVETKIYFDFVVKLLFRGSFRALLYLYGETFCKTS